MADNNEVVVAIPFGTGAVPVDVTMQDPPGGPYQVEITDMRAETSQKSGKLSYRFPVTIVEEGPAKGLTTMIYIGGDFTKDFNKSHFANLLLGLGLDPAKLKGTINVKKDHVVGKKAFIYVREPMDGEVDEETGRPQRANKNFVTKPAYEAAKRAQNIAAGQPAPAAAAKKNGKANGAAQAETKAEESTPTAEAAGTDLDSMFNT